MKGRLRKAEQFLVAAETIDLVLDDEEDPDVSDAFVTLCISARSVSRDDRKQAERAASRLVDNAQRA